MPDFSTVVTINSGDTVSTAFATAALKTAHAHVPSYAAITVYVQGSTDTTSANYFRCVDSDIGSGGAGLWELATASGGRTAALHPSAVGLPSCRFEFSTAATVPMSIAVTGRA